ncbi:probable chitinase 10, partial [Limulus polyphemus]|uniref:Probable chitinase 10 n=1 Tax=Limulus polyphemus TaxID=6850 RepID=A0ABM1BQK9_LIMPO
TVTGLKPYLPKNECPCDCCTIPDPKDCTKFTLCINGNAIKQTCADGLRFNPKIENCDYGRNVDCDPPCDKDCDEKPTQPPGKPCDKEPPPEGECDCDCCIKPVPGDCAAYIRCENYQKFHGRCTNGLLFNPKISNCDFAENVDCDDKPEPDSKCDSKSGLFPHPNDCTRFIHCANWRPYVKNCPAGLHFNKVLKICDWPETACCDACPTEPTTTTTTTTVGKPDCGCDGCMTPHENDCSAYYRCSNGHRELLYCQSGLYFNKQTKACDYPKNVQCEKFICPSPEGMFKNDDDCGSYWQCHNGYPYLKDCNPKLHWNEKTKRCDWPCFAKCDPSVPPCPTESTSVQTSPNPCECTNCVTPHPSDCSAYYRCKDGTRELVYCSPGLYFNKITKVCDHPKNVDCNHFVCPSKDGMFKNEFDCGTFWHCSHGIAYLKDCLSGLHWDEERQKCDVPCLAKCDPTRLNQYATDIYI